MDGKPITPLLPDDGRPIWMQVLDLFQAHGILAPPVKLRDEIVNLWSWAQYAARVEADDYIDQLNVLCEDFGCEPGADRLQWLHEQLSILCEFRPDTAQKQPTSTVYEVPSGSPEPTDVNAK